MAKVQYLNPPGLGPAQGLYSMCTLVPAGTDTYHVAGQLAVGKDGAIVGVGDFAAQFHQVFSNLGDLLKALGETWDSVIVFRTYLVHSQSIPKFMELRKALFPKLFSTSTYPPNTLLMIDRLVKEEFVIELEAVVAKTKK
ncbi:MAG: RidA family protein [Alphaproteobacteria bacterium]|nr:RidA family protein [Alphaproteobacteria bacterium]